MYIGAHLSVAGGYDRAVAYALEVGAECMQVFAKSPRQWKGRAIDPGKAAEFVRARETAGLGPLFTHTAYLINLSTTDESLRERSIAALADEIDRGVLLGATGVVTHLGNDPGGDRDRAAVRAAESIEAAFGLCDTHGGETMLLLENAAGAGSIFGTDATEIGAVFAALGDSARRRTAVCLDTCHAHAWGTDLSTPEAWTAVIDDIERACGAGSLRAIHANDCAYERGSRKDRHAWIGEGLLGDASFEAMMCERRLRSVSVVTEMPGEVPEKDVRNIERLKAMRSGRGVEWMPDSRLP